MTSEVWPSNRTVHQVDTVLAAVQSSRKSMHTLAYGAVLSVTNELRRGELAIIDAEDLRIERPLHMVWNKGRSLSPGSQALFDLIVATTATSLEA